MKMQSWVAKAIQTCSVHLRAVTTGYKLSTLPNGAETKTLSCVLDNKFRFREANL